MDFKQKCLYLFNFIKKLKYHHIRGSVSEVKCKTFSGSEVKCKTDSLYIEFSIEFSNIINGGHKTQVRMHVETYKTCT